MVRQATESTAPKTVKSMSTQATARALQATEKPGRDGASEDATEGVSHRLQVYSAEDHLAWLAQVRSASAEEGLRLLRMCHRLPRGPLLRPLQAPPDATAFEALRQARPNFVTVLDCLSDAATLCRRSNTGFRSLPILLLGDPGVGKTEFVRAVALAMGATMRSIGMAHATAGFALGGMDAGWAGAQPGWPFRELVWGASANPLVLLDEIDKVSGDERHNPLGPLYSLLEPTSARHFCDEMITIPIDCSAIVWFATANDASRIPTPLLSRFEVFHVAPPTAAQHSSVLRSVWRELRLGEPWWGAHFEPDLPGETLQALSGSGPRDAAKRLRRGAARAAVSGRHVVLPQDLPDPADNGARRAPMGFT